MNANSTVHVKVEGGGEQVVAHVGLHALGAFADRLGLGHSLSSRIPITGERLPLHDRGKVLVQAMLMLAGGGEACTDIEHLRAQERLFGSVPSDSTLYRTLRAIDAQTLAGLWEAVADVRAQVWRRSAATTGTAPVVLDIDSSLVEVHSENKEGTGPTYKGGFGFNPLLCSADATGEILAALLRPGNAGTTTVADHLEVLDAALGQLPLEIVVGHHDGDDASLVRRDVRVRTDSAGCSGGFVWGCRARNVGFAVVARSNPQLSAAISKIATNEARWSPAVDQHGEERPGAAVAELTDLVDLGAWPPGTRLILRREPLHPGAQQSLFPSLAYRYWGHYTDAPGDPVALDMAMRAHARVEDNVRRLRDSGFERFPFVDLDANRAWLAEVCFADALVRWFQLLCCRGPLAAAEPKTLRWALWHSPARVVRKAGRWVVRILEGWPTADELVAAYRRIARIT
ncbi:MAG TPA: IS1380 family transposase [Acidimicrobiales bacterium]|nr:IS1380 family transposase [Acidimicrobiales bacterium]